MRLSFALAPVQKRACRLWPAWRWTLLLLPLLSVLPLTPVYGGGATAIVLRYHFVTGQHFAYRVIGIASENTVQVGQAPSRTIFAADGVVSYRILDVSPTGVADAAARIDSDVITQTVNGKRRVFHLSPALAALETPQHVRLGPDNSLPGRKSGAIVSNSYGNYGVQAVGALPPYPVVLGQHWQSSASDNLASGIDTAIPALPHVRLFADNTLIGFSVDAGVPVAVISSASNVNYTGETIQGGRAVHVRVTGTLRITSLFDLLRRLLRASTAAIDFTYTVTSPDSAGGRFLAQTHFLDDATLRPAAVSRSSGTLPF